MKYEILDFFYVSIFLGIGDNNKGIEKIDNVKI